MWISRSLGMRVRKRKIERVEKLSIFVMVDMQPMRNAHVNHHNLHVNHHSFVDKHGGIDSRVWIVMFDVQLS